MHFIVPAPYLRIMPPALPWPDALVAISGAAEIAGGIGLMIPSARSSAAIGLIALLIAVFPANIYMATAQIRFNGIAGEPWAQWLRLPLQAAIIWWVWRCRNASSLNAAAT